MKQLLLVVFLSVLLPLSIKAQYKPQYFKHGDTSLPAIRFFTLGGGTIVQDTTQGLRMQVIYLDSVFGKTVPAGYITAIYLRRAPMNHGFVNGGEGHMYNVQMSLGYTRRDTFKATNGHPTGSVKDSFITGLTKVWVVSQFEC